MLFNKIAHSCYHTSKEHRARLSWPTSTVNNLLHVSHGRGMNNLATPLGGTTMSAYSYWKGKDPWVSLPRVCNWEGPSPTRTNRCWWKSNMRSTLWCRGSSHCHISVVRRPFKIKNYSYFFWSRNSRFSASVIAVNMIFGILFLPPTTHLAPRHVTGIPLCLGYK